MITNTMVGSDSYCKISCRAWGKSEGILRYARRSKMPFPNTQCCKQVQVARKWLVRAWTSHAGAECTLDTHVLVLALVHACEYIEGGAQLLHRKQNIGKIEITGSSRAYNTLYERWWVCWAKEAVQEPPGIDQLLTLCILSHWVSSTRTPIASACTRGYKRLFGER